MTKAKKSKNIFVKIKEFFEGVKMEISKINWTSKSKLFKFSVVTLGFMLFICIFFVVTDLIIALLSYVKELIG